MRRRATPGRKPAKTKHFMPTRPKHRDAAKTARQNNLSVSDLQEHLKRQTRELDEAREQQAATSEVLRVIASSPADLKPVFEMILNSAVRLFGAYAVWVTRIAGDQILLAAHTSIDHGVEAAGRELFPRPLRSEGTLARVIRDRAPFIVTDAHNDDRVPKAQRAFARTYDFRSWVVVPLLRHDEVVGTIGVARRAPGEFVSEEIALLQTFADQAVIAIENTRVLNELRERTEEVVKLNRQLEQRVADQVGEIERMSRLRRFLPPQVADLIVASGTEKQLESHRREITALFCDLRGFTGFSESADPEDVMALLCDYHAAIGKIIIKYGGTLERYAGDGVMVVFNDPVPVDNPALQGVLMALEMRRAIGALTENWRRWGHDIGFGIGIAHGYATLGTIGFEGRFDYAAMGTVCNVASRLCDEAKSGQILITSRVLTAIGDAVTVELMGEFTLKGIRRPLAAHNVLALKSGS